MSLGSTLLPAQEASGKSTGAPGTCIPCQPPTCILRHPHACYMPAAGHCRTVGSCTDWPIYPMFSCEGAADAGLWCAPCITSFYPLDSSVRLVPPAPSPQVQEPKPREMCTFPKHSQLVNGSRTQNQVSLAPKPVIFLSWCYGWVRFQSQTVLVQT